MQQNKRLFADGNSTSNAANFAYHKKTMFSFNNW